MARVKGAMMTRKRRKKTLKLAKGYWGAKSKHFKMAKQAVMKSGNYAYIGRKQRKRDFRRLWITRISAGCRMNGINYSTFMNGLKKAGVTLNRKMLSEIAIADPASFSKGLHYAGRIGKARAAYRQVVRRGKKNIYLSAEPVFCAFRFSYTTGHFMCLPHAGGILSFGRRLLYWP